MRLSRSGPLVVGLGDVPRRLGRVGAGEHGVLRLRVVDPAPARLEIHAAQLPLLGGVVQARLEPALLLLVADREPVLDEDDPGAQQVVLELGAGPEELLVLLLRAEAHHVLDARAVVPAAVEQDDLAGGRQVGHVALEVPLRALALGRRPERDDAHDAGVRLLGDALDRPALARGVAALEHDDHLQTLVDDPVLKADHLDLQARELLLIRPPAHPPGHRRAAGVERRSDPCRRRLLRHGSTLTHRSGVPPCWARGEAARPHGSEYICT